MSPIETFQIGRTLYLEKEYYHCAKWMNAAERLLDNTASSTPFYSDILDYESFCYSQSGNMPKALKLTNQILSYGVHPDMERIESNYHYYTRKLKETESTTEDGYLKRPTHWNSAERDEYERLCQIGKNNSQNTHDGIDGRLEVSTMSIFWYFLLLNLCFVVLLLSRQGQLLADAWPSADRRNITSANGRSVS